MPAAPNKLFVNFPIDKVAHLAINALLVFLWSSVLVVIAKAWPKILYIGLLLIICIIYGILIELCQELFTTTRRADVWDVVANTVGCMLGAVSSYLFKNVFIK